MRKATLLLLSASILLAIPAATADTTDELMAFDIDADEVVVRMQVTMTGEDAQNMRDEIDDEHGNGDDVVTLDEVSRYNAEGTMRFDEDTPSCFEDFELARIDGTRPKRMSLMSGRAEQATGLVTSTTPIRVTAAFTLLYPTKSAPSHQVEVEFDEMDSFGESVGCFFGTWADQMGDHFDGAGEPGLESYDGWSGMETADWADYWDDYDQYAQASSGFQSDTPDGDDPKTVVIQPKLGYTIDEQTIQPQRARALWDGTALRADSESEQLVLFDEVVSVAVRSHSASAPLGGTVMDVGAYVGFAVMGGGLLALVAAGATEYGRFQLWKLLILLPGFSRMEKDEVLEHTKRDELYRFIKQNPGQSFSDLRRELALSNGTLVHHLRILEGQEYLKGVRDGFRTRFYVRGPKIVMDSYLTRTQIQLVEAISANPGLTQKELSQLLGLPRESISYHAKQLAAKGRLAIKQQGKWRRYWPNAPTPSAASAAPGQA
jgi:DNA-binding MarR family transcriptional regulator